MTQIHFSFTSFRYFAQQREAPNVGGSGRIHHLAFIRFYRGLDLWVMISWYCDSFHCLCLLLPCSPLTRSLVYFYWIMEDNPLQVFPS